MDASNEDVKLAGVRERHAEDGVEWRQMFDCGYP